MNGSPGELRKMLRSEPYISIEPWRDGLDLAGEGYLEELDLEKLIQVKGTLDVVLQTGSYESLRSHYEDEIYP